MELVLQNVIELDETDTENERQQTINLCSETVLVIVLLFSLMPI